MFAFASLLYDNLQGGEMLFEKKKPEALAEVFIFQTTFRHRGGYYTTNTRTKILF
jgi:hypothetical protein